MVFPPRHEEVSRRLKEHRGDERVQHELKEMQETNDLRQVDDDVEDIATIFEWHTHEHTHQPKSPKWFMILAIAITVLVAWFLISFNFIAAITTAFVGGFIYYIAQHKPAIKRYRLMVDGAAIGNTLYHYKDLEAFNIVYEPGETKTILLRSKHKFSPLIHMEIGDADPVIIRDILLEFVPEDQELEEPLVDIVARRLGF